MTKKKKYFSSNSNKWVFDLYHSRKNWNSLEFQNNNSSLYYFFFYYQYSCTESKENFPFLKYVLALQTIFRNKHQYCKAIWILTNFPVSVSKKNEILKINIWLKKSKNLKSKLKGRRFSIWIGNWLKK